jgi:hypothetical protein
MNKIMSARLFVFIFLSRSTKIGSGTEAEHLFLNGDEEYQAGTPGLSALF